MAPRTSLIEVIGILYDHIDRRPRPDLPGFDRLRTIPRTLALVQACKATLITGGTTPYYDPKDDVISMPSPAFYCLARLYTRPTTYSLTLLHELCHWSGHRSRLARPAHTTPGDAIYCREEVLAELGSVLLCADLAITSRPTLGHAKYLTGYLAASDNPTVDLQVAMARANQAVGFIIAIARRELTGARRMYA